MKIYRTFQLLLLGLIITAVGCEHNSADPGWFFGSAENRGWIRNVTFRNIEIQDEDLPYSIVKGWDADHQVKDVLFENITMMGSKLMDESALGLIYHNSYYNNILIR